MLASFLTFLNENPALNQPESVRESNWLLTVSGGIDSVVLVDLCYRAGIRFGIAHVNFGLRGDESEGDEAFVRQLAVQYKVPFHCTHVETKHVAKEQGISVQMAARELRYAWFKEVADTQGYDVIATAHHQNDVLETVLLNLVRGTGIAGLRGIPIRNGQIIRPLWFATRPQIFAYLQENGLPWREDRSNSDDKYQRNLLRHQVVPKLEGLNPNLWHTFQQTIERLRATESLLTTELSRSWEQVADCSIPDRILIQPSRLLALPEPAFRLAEWLRPYGFSGEQVRLILESLKQPPGQLFDSATHRIWHDRLGLLLTPLPDMSDVNRQWLAIPAGEIKVTDQMILHFQEAEKPADYKPITDRNTACLDVDRLLMPLTVRRWQLGDRFRPLGMNGSKLVSDLLNDQKVSLAERQQVCVLLAGDEIAWVIGYRVGHSFRIQSQTRRVLEVRKV